MSADSQTELLNAPQRRAATYGQAAPEKGWQAGPLLVVAGAGTGKTSTIAHRVAQLAVHNVDPARVLLLTFTRRAAAEMRRRVHDIVRESLGDTLGNKAAMVLQRLTWAGTFHSIGNRLLRHYARHINLDPTFTVIDRSDSSDLLDDVRAELGLASKDQRFPRKDTCLAMYSMRLNTQRSLRETLEQQFPYFKHWEEELTRLFRTYVERKQRYNLLDYDDLLVYWHLMMGDARLAQHVSGNFDHVLVDEYQDTNRLQAEILHAMKPDGAGVTVVGDDAQAIYSFRGAEVENILSFPGRFTPKAEVVTLAQNYRSMQGVLDLANALMAEAPRQHRKHLLAVRPGAIKPLYVTLDDLAGQAEYVCGQILKRRESGVALRSQAVLFRNASASDVLEVELARRRIPFVKYGGLKFLEAAHIKDLMGVLRWADNPRNTLAAFRTLQLLPGMGPVNARKVVELIEAQNGSLDALSAFTAPREATQPYLKLLNLMKSLAEPQKPWPGQIRQVRDWYQPHLERIYEHFHTRAGDLDQLEQLSTQYPSRERFITEFTLDPPNASSDLAAKPTLDEDYLVLSTVHSAKGMEWDTVYVLNVVDGSFPNEFSTGRAEMVEEERRLLYVALTRARNELQICVPLKFPLTQQPRTGDAHVYGGRSRFVTEKVLKCVHQLAVEGSKLGDASELSGKEAGVDVTARLKEMW
ncbi:MAG TPA: ATP-dependent helicase [Steroidobacteraceae bacterium]|jgi:DNA helicase-2/ATP-dependent DNA helicase PcrA|nr:ATP-dependent helicase [Steroidobacteraceae bacterium]